MMPMPLDDRMRDLHCDILRGAAEAAFTDYVAALDALVDCIEDPDCDLSRAMDEVNQTLRAAEFHYGQWHNHCVDQ